MAVECDCEAWVKGQKSLNGLIVFAHIHGITYTGGEFSFCPWCGKKLEKVPEK